MAGIIERSCGRIMEAALETVNPIKMIVKKTECKVHKFINCQALAVLANDGNASPWLLFNKYLNDLNYGVVWADQDMKSSNHFYNPYTGRGLYGFSNAMKECKTYYDAALRWWHRGDVRRSIICLGVVSHLIQDMTVPQHANVTLLDNHRRFENWVIEAHEKEKGFRCSNNGVYLNRIEEYIQGNAYAALAAYQENEGAQKLEYRFYNIAGKMLSKAQRSTAGLLQLFCNDVHLGDTKIKMLTE